ncbi:failed axon connections homolog [Glandiceps talaboti]
MYNDSTMKSKLLWIVGAVTVVAVSFIGIGQLVPESLQPLYDDLTMKRKLVWTAGALTVAAVSFIGIRKLVPRKRDLVDLPKDTVILRQIGRSRYVPNISPFPLKLETYLRFANIPYVSVHGLEMSPKNKTPWIELNGESFSDSGFIIEMLNERFNVDLSKHLSPSERATARAFEKMVEENLYWTLAYYRWFGKNPQVLLLMPEIPILTSLGFRFFRRSLGKMMYGHGMGRHSEEEIYSIAEKDIRALSVFLGDKKFMFGDEPCQEDCAIFGQLAQVVWQLSGSPQEVLVKGDCKNLEGYCCRMRERFWPDWEQCIMGDQKLQSFNSYPDSDPTLWKEK